MPPAGIGEQEIQLAFDGFVEGGGEVLEPGELSVVGYGGGAGERGGRDKLGGAFAGAAGGGDNAAFGRRGEPDGGGERGGHEAPP